MFLSRVVSKKSMDLNTDADCLGVGGGSAVEWSVAGDEVFCRPLDSPMDTLVSGLVVLDSSWCWRMCMILWRPGIV